MIPPEIFEDMKNIWSVFVNEKDEVHISELRTIMRALDIDPNEDELDYLTKRVDPDQTGFFKFPNL